MTTKLNTFILIIVAFLTVYLESAFSPLRDWVGVQPDLLPSLMVYIGLTSTLSNLAAVAIAAGLWYDSLSANPLGVTMLPLFLIGFVLRNYQGLILRNQHYAQWILGGIASGVAPVLTLVLLWMHGRQPLVSWFSIWQWTVMIVVGAAATPLWFLGLDRLTRALNYGAVDETSFRADRQIKRGRY